MKAHRFLVGWLVAAGCSGALAQTKISLSTQSKAVDFTGASLTKPARSAASLPSTCSAGEMFYLSGGPFYSCSTTNNWIRVGTVSGSTNSGDCARFDANGDVVDGGAACGGPNYQQSFTSATSVTLTHNLNSTGIVFACFDNSTPPLWILPKSVAMTNANTLTVSFASAQSGSCVVNASGASTSPAFLMGSSSLSFGSIAQAACAQSAFSLTGANPGDTVAPGWPATLAAGLTGTMNVSASNTITVQLCNLSGATATPAAQTFKATVIH